MSKVKYLTSKVESENRFLSKKSDQVLRVRLRESVAIQDGSMGRSYVRVAMAPDRYAKSSDDKDTKWLSGADVLVSPEQPLLLRGWASADTYDIRRRACDARVAALSKALLGSSFRARPEGCDQIKAGTGRTGCDY